MDYYHRPNCRLCSSNDVELVLKMAPCPPVDAFLTEARQQTLFPMDLYLCRSCGHAQLLDVVSPDLLFQSYIYTTQSSPGLVAYFSDYADHVAAKLVLQPGAAMLDIGSNDGTLLSFFKAKDMRVLGVDPAREIAGTASAAGLPTIADFFTSQTAASIAERHGRMDLITANNVFAHSDSLGDMADGVRLLLAPDGSFVFEVSYLLDMVENMVFDFIYHEHLSHHSIKPLQNFLKLHGLHLYDVERTPSKGGTIRCFAQIEGGPRPSAPAVAELLALEEQFGLYDTATYQTWAARIDEAKAALLNQLAAWPGLRLAGYGASATATVLTYHFDLVGKMDFIVEDNPVRQGRLSPGEHLPVISSDGLSKSKADAIIILAWRFADMIILRNQDYLKSGGKFVIPLPTLRIVG